MTLVQGIALAIFVVTFASILLERVHRAIIAMASAVVMVVVGMALGFYTQEEALASIDSNTIGLLLGMMILVHLLGKTGFFQYLAILMAKRSGGNPWLLLVVLSVSTAVLSMLLDNVTTVVLIAPVTILIAEIVGMDPIMLLVSEAMLSNVAGTGSLVGDPPNILIGSAADFTFVNFLTHLGPIVLVAVLVTLLVLRLVFRHQLAERPKKIEALAGLNEKEALSDPATLRKVAIILGAVILLFFLHGVLHLTPGFIALGGAAAAFLWVQPDVDDTLRHVEWTVLAFFAALFVTVGGLEASGLLGALAVAVGGLASENLLLASLVLLWTAALASSVVDNIPFTIALIPVIQSLGSMGISVTPLWWALALGAGFGGNGTPIGATANVVVVTLSERTHTPITARIWLRTGLPVMIATCAVASLMFILLFGWMNTP